MLPVTFKTFTAVENNKNIFLQWEAISTNNNQHYIVEKSIDGINFNMIGSTTVATINNSYSFTDTNPFAGLNYYRIKKQDTNGSYVYSAVVKVLTDAKQTSLHIFPNPVIDKININVFSPKNATAVVVIADALGRVFYRQQKQITKGTNVLSLEKTHQFSKGFYSVSLNIDGAVYHDRFCVVQ